ncbi:propanediol utilization [Salmonella enterica subsp. enterica]|nr:propanediol utilization [Salmonella enterica subsp. enterica]
MCVRQFPLPKAWPAAPQILPLRQWQRHIILGHSLDETTLAQLCVSIEPTDSTVFHQLTLFDHNNAATQIACEPPPPIDLLVLESPVTLRTQDYHRLLASRN